MQSLFQEYSIYSRYYAPRGRDRLDYLGKHIALQHLKPGDKLVGVIGDPGSGKSSITKGMFPDLELSNDDTTLDPRKMMQVRDLFEDIPDQSIYHIDMRFQTAFTQMFEITNFVTNILNMNRMIVVEHFDLLYPALQINADLLIGIGEEIIVTRPGIFGPLPKNVQTNVHNSLIYRKMAHTVEDITIQLLDEFGISNDVYYNSDVHSGFVLRFTKKIDLDFKKLSEAIKEKLNLALPVSYVDEDHIKIGELMIECTGPRLHVRNTSEIVNFELVEKFIEDPRTNTFCLVGLIKRSNEKDEVHSLY